ncbi:MAG: methyltransferase [Chloroflexi bacterium]|nr:MAG: methyltransferase [Chloroflexota bacterium]
MQVPLFTTLRKQIPPEQRQGLLQLLRRLAQPAWLGTMRRTTPLNDNWGIERGTPIDRYYIDCFLRQHVCDIHGRVLEIRDNRYTKSYGMGVIRSDILDINPANQRATVIADLTAADAILADQFDCFILTQTLQYIYDTRAAVAHAHRILRPGGVLLATVPCVTRISPRYGLQTDHWRFTVASCTTLFGTVFGAEQVTVCSYGNMLTSIAFLAGLATEDLSEQELDSHDAYFPLLVTVRAVKQAAELPVGQVTQPTLVDNGSDRKR